MALHALNADGLPGARGPPFPASLLDPPRPPNRTDSTSQPPASSSLPLPPPPPSLSAELLELGDSLMKLGSLSGPYELEARPPDQLCSRHTYSHGALPAPYSADPAHSDCSHRPEPSAPTLPYVLEHIAIKEPSYCHSGAYLAEAEHAASCALERPQSLPPPGGSYAREHTATYDGGPPNPDGSYNPCPEHSSSYTQERPAAYALDRPAKPDPQPPAQLCLLSPEPEPELLLSPVIPPGGPFTPSDPQSLESLDPTASAQLLDNIMAWFNNNINPQNNPQSLALIPSPPTTESDSSPDTHTETESESQASRDPTPAPVWQPLEGQPEAGRGPGSPRLGAEGPKTPRPSTLDVEDRAAGEEGVDAGCVADLSLDEAHTHPCSHSPAHTASATETDLDLILQLEGEQLPEEEWEEQVHLV